MTARKALLFVLSLCLAACASPYVYRIDPSPTTTNYQTSKYSPPIKPFRQVAILPFADYSEITFLQDRGYPNNAVMESVADHFVAHNVQVIPQEDVDRLLLEMGVLPNLQQLGVMPDPQTLLYNGPHIFNHEFEHHDQADVASYVEDMGFSDGLVEMLNEQGRRHTHRGAPDSGVATSGIVRVPNKVKTRNVYGLSKEDLRYVAGKLGAEAVVRGRILEYGLKKTPTLDPAWGLGAANRIAMGLDWALLDDKDSGDYAAGEPREEIRPEIDQWRVSPFGSPFGLFARLFGPPNIRSSAIVQVRVYIQDGRTGDVLWTNRAEVETTPFSVFHFDDQHLKNLFDDATHKAVAEIMQSFFHARDGWGSESQKS